MKARCIGLILYVALNAFFNISIAQISSGGTPLNFRKNLKSSVNIPKITLPAVNVSTLMEEDAITENLPDYPYRFAKAFRIDVELTDQGLLEEMPNGDKLVQLSIYSKSAYSLQVIFDKYVLPEGARLFIYSRDKKHVLGAFNHKNNKPSKKLAIAPVPGDEIFLEYFEPGNAEFSGELKIGQVSHAYKSIFNPQDDRYGLSQPCNKDINCAEGNDWQVEKRAVCRIIFTKGESSYLCSGSLINNTRNDGAPYLLTANHCLPTYLEAETAVFYFNYESPTCLGPDGDDTQTISGATIKATTWHLDFSLVELSDTVPAEYQPYFAGWDITPDAPEKVTTIHHPKGDVKKISYFNEPPETGDFIYEFDFDDSTHWFIPNWTQGITEGGSSGCPLFNQDHRIVGDLTGGSVVANCTSADAYFAKISHSWADYNDSIAQLKYWLDPDNTGVTFFDGYDPFAQNSAGEIENEKKFFIYPNPSKGLVCINFHEPIHGKVVVFVYDITGKVLHSKIIFDPAKRIELDFENQPNGLYLVRIITDDYLITKRIIKYGSSGK